MAASSLRAGWVRVGWWSVRVSWGSLTVDSGYISKKRLPSSRTIRDFNKIEKIILSNCLLVSGILRVMVFGKLRDFTDNN